MRSALPSAVSCEGKARQPLAFSCLFSYRLPISAQKVRKPFQTALCFRRACVYPIRSCISPHGATQGLTRRSHLHHRSFGFVIGFRQIHFLSGEAAVEYLAATFLTGVIRAKRLVSRNRKIMQGVGLPFVIRRAFVFTYGKSDNEHKHAFSVER